MDLFPAVSCDPTRKDPSVEALQAAGAQREGKGRVLSILHAMWYIFDASRGAECVKRTAVVCAGPLARKKEGNV